MKEQILKYVGFLKSTQSRRDKKFKEFHEFHKWCLENVPPNLWKSISQIKGVCWNNSDYGMGLSITDYNWWGALYDKNPQLLMNDVEDIKKKFTTNLADSLMEYKFDTPSDKDSVSELLKLIDDTYKSTNI